MTVQINYKSSISKKVSSNLILFTDEKFNITGLKRYISKGGSARLFFLLDKHQLKDSKKMKFCNHIVVNNRSLSILKNKLSNIIELYE